MSDAKENISLIAHYIMEFKYGQSDAVSELEWMIGNLRQLVHQCKAAKISQSVIDSFEWKIEFLERQIEEEATDGTLIGAFIQSQALVRDSLKFI